MQNPQISIRYSTITHHPLHLLLLSERRIQQRRCRSNPKRRMMMKSRSWKNHQEIHTICLLPARASRLKSKILIWEHQTLLDWLRRDTTVWLQSKSSHMLINSMKPSVSSKSSKAKWRDLELTCRWREVVEGVEWWDDIYYHKNYHIWSQASSISLSHVRSLGFLFAWLRYSWSKVSST